MLTDDQKITTPDYWNKIYQGKNNDAKVDASNTKRPANPFDRFGWVAAQAEGPFVLGVASGHAHIEKRIRAKHPAWGILATDQAEAAITVAKFTPYQLADAYKLPRPREVFSGTDQRTWNTVIIAQALEYLADDERFIQNTGIIGDKLLISLPMGEMEKWSQLRIYSEQSVRDLLEPYGKIETFDRQGDLLLVKLKYNRR